MSEENSAVMETNAAPPMRMLTMVVYGLFAASVLVGFTGLVGVIIAHLKLKEAQGTIFESHLRWLIRTFWISFAVFLIGVLLSFVGIGLLVILAAAIWVIYRVVIGFLKLNDGKAIDDPARLF
ncbi:MAG: membrane protein [Rhodospirillaceae bacterium BRH_c57]|nr:MAG: membrane protein [Rhodospirillaceae bacterium BRH_c57]